MGNVSAKDRVLEEAAGDGVDSAAAAAAAGGPAAEAVAIGTTNGSSVLQPFNGVADMISDGQLASANVNVVCRYRQISGQAAAAAGGGGGHGSSSLDNGDACIGPSVLSPMASPLSESSGMAANPPSIIAAQLPQVPVCWADELGQPWMHSSQSNDYESQTENMIATMIEWKHGGSDVSVEGSWDNWSSRIPLQRTGKGFTLVKFLPAGVYHYKFLVNGEQRHAPDLPHMYDEKGKGINIIDVQDYVPENLDGIAEFEAPGSPDSSYDSPFPGPEEYSKDPPLLPSQLHYNSELECLHQHPSSTVNSNSGSTNSSMRPQHVILNHLFVETRKAASSPVLTLGFTQRFRSKYVTVILHKPLKR